MMLDAPESGERIASAHPLPPNAVARWIYDRRIEELQNKIRYLRGVVLVLLGVTGLAVHGVVSLSREVKIMPFIVQVDRLGQPLAYARADQMPTPDERMVRGELARFIAGMRTVYTDPVAQTQTIDRWYLYTHRAARTFVDAYFRDPANNHHVLGKSIIRMTEMRSMREVPGSAGTWDLQWQEFEVPLRGGAPTVSAWQAYARTAVVPPRDEDDVYDNPLGLHITDLTWRRVSERQRVDLDQVNDVVRRQADDRIRREFRNPGLAPEPSPDRGERPQSVAPQQ